MVSRFWYFLFTLQMLQVYECRKLLNVILYKYDHGSKGKNDQGKQCFNDRCSLGLRCFLKSLNHSQTTTSVIPSIKLESGKRNTTYAIKSELLIDLIDYGDIFELEIIINVNGLYWDRIVGKFKVAMTNSHGKIINKDERSVAFDYTVTCKDAKNKLPDCKGPSSLRPSSSKVMSTSVLTTRKSIISTFSNLYSTYESPTPSTSMVISSVDGMISIHKSSALTSRYYVSTSSNVPIFSYQNTHTPTMNLPITFITSLRTSIPEKYKTITETFKFLTTDHPQPTPTISTSFPSNGAIASIPLSSWKSSTISSLSSTMRPNTNLFTISRQSSASRKQTFIFTSPMTTELVIQQTSISSMRPQTSCYISLKQFTSIVSTSKVKFHSIHPPTVSPVTEKQNLDLKLIMITSGGVAVSLIVILVCCLCCQRRRLQKKLDEYNAQNQELSDLRAQLSHSNKESAIRDRTFSNISLAKDAHLRHQKNKDLLDQQGSEFIGFHNELFQPDVDGRRSRLQGKRPSIGPNELQISKFRGNDKTVQQMSSSYGTEFPLPPFELMNPLFIEQGNYLPPPPPPPPPTPPPPPPPPPLSQIQHPVSRTNNVLHIQKQPLSQQPALISLLDEFKSKMETSKGEVSSEGRLMRASTLTQEKNVAKEVSKTRATTICIPKTLTKPKRRIVRFDNKETCEDEFLGFHNKTFDPSVGECSSYV